MCNIFVFQFRFVFFFFFICFFVFCFLVFISTSTTNSQDHLDRMVDPNPPVHTQWCIIICHILAQLEQLVTIIVATRLVRMSPHHMYTKNTNLSHFYYQSIKSLLCAWFFFLLFKCLSMCENVCVCVCGKIIAIQLLYFILEINCLVFKCVKHIVWVSSYFCLFVVG